MREQPNIMIQRERMTAERTSEIINRLDKIIVMLQGNTEEKRKSWLQKLIFWK